MWNFSQYGCLPACITERGEIITYYRLHQLQEECYIYMSGKDLVFLAADTSSDSILIYISCIMHHIPICMVDSKTPEKQMIQLLERFQPTVIWIPSYLSMQIQAIDNWLRSKNQAEQNIRQKIWRDYLLFSVMWETEGGCVPDPGIALLLPTSGSTGLGKYVMLSDKNIQANTEAIINRLEICTGDRAMVMLPQCYSYGLSVINTYLMQGGTLLLPYHSWLKKEFWEFFQNNAGNAISGVPFLYQMLRKINFSSIKLPDLKLMTQAGGALDRSSKDYFLKIAQSRQIDFAVMYGQTEATARISSFFLNRFPEKKDSVGTVLEGGRLQILCKQSAASDIGNAAGEILYAGNNVFCGYAYSREDLQNSKKKEILYTGDIGYLDADGYLFLTGRMKRIAKLYGMRIQLDEIEQTLFEKHGLITACVEENEKLVIIFDDAEWKESTVCSLLEQMGIEKNMIKSRYVSTLPRTVSGKIAYRELGKEKMNGSAEEFI